VRLEYGGVYLSFVPGHNFFLPHVKYMPDSYSSTTNTDEDPSNEIVLVAIGATLTAYANGEWLRDLNIASRTEGFLGVHTYLSSTCTFEDTWVWDLREPGEDN